MTSLLSVDTYDVRVVVFREGRASALFGSLDVEPTEPRLGTQDLSNGRRDYNLHGLQ